MLSSISDDLGARLGGMLDTGIQAALDTILSKLGISGLVGTFGPVLFSVSQSSVRTFEQISRTSEARFAEHDVIGLKPVSEYTGPGLQRIEFPMVLHAGLGIEPMTEIGVLQDLLTAGKARPLIVGTRFLGRFTIRDISEEWTHFGRFGRPILIRAEVSLAEYVETVPTQAVEAMRLDEVSRGETGKGGPERLGGDVPTQTRKLEPINDMDVGQ